MDAGLVDEQSTLNNTKNSGSYETISPDDNALIADQNFLAVYQNFFRTPSLFPYYPFRRTETQNKTLNDIHKCFNLFY